MPDKEVKRREPTKKEIIEGLESLLTEYHDKNMKLEYELEKTQGNLLELSDIDNVDLQFGPADALRQQNKLLREENNKLKVERNKAVRELKSIKKKLLKLGE